MHWHSRQHEEKDQLTPDRGLFFKLLRQHKIVSPSKISDELAESASRSGMGEQGVMKSGEHLTGGWH
jgi:hypothetical protein